MIRIRVLNGPAFLISKDRIQQVQQLFRQSFPSLESYADKIPSLLHNPMRFGYRTSLVIAERASLRVDAFALVMHFPETGYSFLDFFATRADLRGGGVGGALYESVRELCQEIGDKGLFIEVQPDDVSLTTDSSGLEAAKRRVAFYERYGVRKIENDAYERPIGDPPTYAYLLFDGLNRDEALGQKAAQRSLELILTLRFGHIVDSSYIKDVLTGFRDNPVRLRPTRYIKKVEKIDLSLKRPRLTKSFVVVTNPHHEIHHVKERGYFERPIRVKTIQQILEQMGLYHTVEPATYSDRHILAVHQADFVYYIRTISTKLKDNRPVYPDTFPIRRLVDKPKVLAAQAGYYCIDTGTPLYPNAYKAARSAVNTVLTATDELLSGKRLVYAVCRPPGHHAGKSFFGGFCYFNNAAIAAQYLSGETRVAMLDLDYHHGNGTQDIFYERSDVLTVSIHGHPDYAYPYFSGYEKERGQDQGEGYNLNFPLLPKTDEKKYLTKLDKALHSILDFRPEVLVVGLGFDILKGDPTGLFQMKPLVMKSIGEKLMALNLPILLVQEGGYNLRNIRGGCRYLFEGIWKK